MSSDGLDVQTVARAIMASWSETCSSESSLEAAEHLAVAALDAIAPARADERVEAAREAYERVASLAAFNAFERRAVMRSTAEAAWDKGHAAGWADCFGTSGVAVTSNPYRADRTAGGSER